MSGLSSASQKESTTGLTGNQSGTQTNAAVNSSTQQDTTASEIAGTLPADTRIKNTVFETKGEDKTVPDGVNAPGEGLQTAGAGGDLRKPQDFASHEESLPGSNTHAGAGFSEKLTGSATSGKSHGV